MPDITYNDTAMFDAGTIWFDGPIDRAAADLFHHMRTGYTPGYEMQLTDRIIDGLDDQTRNGLLHFAVLDHMHDLAGMGGVLDECDQRSYDTTAAMAGLLLETIKAQGPEQERFALRQLVCDEICERRDRIERNPEMLVGYDATRVSALADEAIADWDTFVGEIRERTARRRP